MQSDGYRYSFQGQEHDDEVKGEGNSVNYKYRMHDPRVGRFFAVDPLAVQRSWVSPYNFVQNNPITRVDPTGALDDWYEDTKGNIEWRDETTKFSVDINSKGEVKVWSNIGKENRDIVKHLFGQTSFTATTDNFGTTGMESGPGFVASSRARVFTILSVSIQANVSYDGKNRTFKGIDFFASTEGYTYAPLTWDKKMDFIATSATFQGINMKPLPEYGGSVIKAPVGSGSYTYSWSAERVKRDFGKSFNRTIRIKGQYTFGGQPLTNLWGPGVVPNTTDISLTIPYKNK
jgi:RHS repeat-associated protein